MRKNLCRMLLFLMGINAAIQTSTAQGIVVNKKDGTKVYFKATDVLSVGVYGYGEEPEPEPEPDNSGKDSNGREWVDLGLPSRTLWATMNVGASTPENYGDYFAWGETKGYQGGKTGFTWIAYKYCKASISGSLTSLTKYCTDNSYGTVDGLSELQSVDDAATAFWGSGWQMPSQNQYEELINSNYTKQEWKTMNGIKGLIITSKSNGNSIFLPASGSRETGSIYNAGSKGSYWSRTLSTFDSAQAYALIFKSDWWDSTNSMGRFLGYNVRPVRVKN